MPKLVKQNDDWIIIESFEQNPDPLPIHFDVFEEPQETGKSGKSGSIEVVKSGNGEENIVEIVLDEENQENGEGGVVVVVIMLILMAYAICKRLESITNRCRH